MAALKVNIRKLSKREIDVHCKNNEEEDSEEDRFIEAVNVQSSCMGSPPATPRKSSSKSKSKSRLSSSKKTMSTVKKGAGGRAKKSIFDVDSVSDSCPSPAPAKRKNSKEDEADLMSFGSPVPKPRDSIVNTPTNYKLKQPKVVIRQNKQDAKVMRNLSQEYIRGDVKEKTTEEDESSLSQNLRMDLPPTVSKSQSDMFYSQTLSTTTVMEAPSPDLVKAEASMLGRLINENLSSDEDEGNDPELDHEKSEEPSLVMDISRDLFSQSQEDGADVNANPPTRISTLALCFSPSSLTSPTKSHETNELLIDDALQEEEDDYQCILCDKTFTESMDHEEHLKDCLKSRPGSFLSPASPKQKRPRSPSPPPLSPVSVKTVPRSPPPRSAANNSGSLPPKPFFSVSMSKQFKIPKLKVTDIDSHVFISINLTNAFAIRGLPRN